MMRTRRLGWGQIYARKTVTGLTFGHAMQEGLLPIVVPVLGRILTLIG